MTTIHRIDPPLNVKTPIMEGWGIFLIDYGPDWNTCWIVSCHKTGAIKHFDANDVALTGNPTYNRACNDKVEWDNEPGN